MPNSNILISYVPQVYFCSFTSPGGAAFKSLLNDSVDPKLFDF